MRTNLKPVFESLEAGIFPGDPVPGSNYTVLKLRIRNRVLIYSKSDQENVDAKTIAEIIEAASEE